MVLTEQLQICLAATELLRQLFHLVVVPAFEAPAFQLLLQGVTLVPARRLIVREEEVKLHPGRQLRRRPGMLTPRGLLLRANYYLHRDPVGWSLHWFQPNPRPLACLPYSVHLAAPVQVDWACSHFQRWPEGLDC